MASLSSDLEGLNLSDLTSGQQTSQPELRTELGARPKQAKKSPANGARSAKSKKNSKTPDIVQPLTTEDPNQLTAAESPPQTPEEVIVKKPSQRRQKRGGKRHFKPSKPETEGIKSEKDPEATDDDKENLGNDCDDSDDDASIRFGTDPVPYAWKNVTKNGWIKKCILVDGKPELGRPTPGDAVLVKTQGKLKDGTIVDDNPTFVFNVGEYEVIEGLDLAVQTMHKNELAIVSIKPELAYGSMGRSRATNGKLEEIPANERITYLLGLLHFEKSRDTGTLTWGQKRKCGQAKMRLANWWFQRKEYSISIKCYKKALTYYNDVPPNHECSSAAESKELMLLLEERLRVMRQVANIFKRIANLIQSGQITI